MIPVIPLGMVAALLWMIDAGRQLEFRKDGNLIFALSESVGEIRPLSSSRGGRRQFETMIFDSLFRRDDELVIRGSLAESWVYRQKLEFFFVDKETAKTAEFMITSLIAEEGEQGPGDKFGKVSRSGSTLSIAYTDYDPGNVQNGMNLFADLEYLPVVKIRLSLKNAARESWADFKKGASEKGQIKREWIEGNQAVVLFVAGDVDQFVKELRIYYDSNRNLDPQIEFVDQSPCLDVAEWVLSLREGVSWHDGRALTSRDVLFSFEEMMRPVVASPVRSAFSHVASVRDLDSHRILVECREFYAPIAESWERLPILPSHLLAGKKVADWQSFFRNPVGTGPYSFAGKNDKEELVLERNPKYFRGSPQQEKVKFRVVNHHDDRSRLMRTGSIDGLWPVGAESDLMRASGKYQFLNDSYRQQTFVAWNLRRPAFHNLAVRQALAHFVNIPELIDMVGGDVYRECRGIFFPDVWFCKTTMNLPNYDPRRGRDLLEQAGWHFNEGAWKNPDGSPLAFTLLFDRDSPDHVRMASLLAVGWRAQGVSVDTLPLAWTDLVMAHLNNRDFDAALVSWDLGFGRDQYQVWHSSQVEAAGGNFFGLSDGQLDRLLEDLKEEISPEEVKALAENLQNQIQQLQPCLFISEKTESIALRSGAVRLARPKSDTTWSDETPTTSPAGLQNEWLWWRRGEQITDVRPLKPGGGIQSR